MSFLGAAECSTARNPLSQFTKHVQDDKSLQQDRLIGQAPGGIQESFRTQRYGPNQDAALQDFLQQTGQIPQEAPQPFSMEQMRRDLPGYGASSWESGSPKWASEFDPSQQARMEAAFRGAKSTGLVPAGFSSAEFQKFHQMERNNSRVSSPLTMNGYQRPMGMGYGMGAMGFFNTTTYPTSMQLRPSEATAQSQVKGKGRISELNEKDWEKQFAEIDAAGKQEDLDAEANAAMERELNDIDRSVLPNISETDHFDDFDSLWRGIQAEKADHARYSRFFGQNPFDDDDIQRNFDTWDTFDGIHTDQFRDPQLGNYQFEPDNIFADTADPFSEGQKIMREAGNLSLAALAFEAALQNDPQHVDAWVALGSAQAQNEKETPAIRALEQALQLDPLNLQALMGLAISYTNEGYDSTAYRTLERWLSVKYPNILSAEQISPASEIGFTDRHILHDKVTQHFIRAAQLSPSGDRMDPDVQVGLGVLFYGAEEYGKAVDCFEAALSTQESGTVNAEGTAHLLWNRLGATLANSGRSEEAIEAYEKALTLRRNFVRARYNLGVSCINIGCNEEAAQHLLAALDMHRVVEKEGVERVREVTGNAGANPGAGLEGINLEGLAPGGMNQSTNLLETLRRVFGNMGRRDLAEKVGAGMDVEQFRSEFDF
ncbi:MAG: hypothetical protein LQ351_007182 [Letrouitia transgressa]|nr:MAG: hypothetical protein LQ351_007182 [Letrouitia transgressa]